MLTLLFLINILLYITNIVFSDETLVPQQIHIAMAGKNGIRINWFTSETTTISYCYYGDDINNINNIAYGESISYLEDHGSHHTVLLNNLKSNTKYYYYVSNDNNNSNIFYFTTIPEDNDSNYDIKLSVLGDMGYLDSISRPMGVLGTKTMAGNWSAVYSRELLELWKDNNEIDMVWHVGDVGYADDAVWHTIKTAVQFEYENAYNDYMNWIQNITAVMPYHVTPGNHESECHDPLCVLRPRELGIPLSNFTAYNARWKMPSPESDGVSSMWYSWDQGNVHFVSINTETDFEDAPENEKGDSGIFNAGQFAPEGTYLTWLENDLIKASQDANIKWIFAGGHRPFKSFNSDKVDELFIKYGVSIYFSGHSHSYSRFDKSEHGNVTTHIIVGGAGCDEMYFSDNNPQPGYHVGTTCEEWSSIVVDNKYKNKYENCEDAVFFTDAYAIGKLTISDGGSGDVKWELFSSIDHTVLDSLTLTKD